MRNPVIGMRNRVIGVRSPIMGVRNPLIGMRNPLLVLWGILALCAAALPAAAYDYPDPTGFDVHDVHPLYSRDYPIFIHDVKAWDYTGSYPGPSGWTEGDYPWHERNLTNSRGMHRIAESVPGEGFFYWHGAKRAHHDIFRDWEGQPSTTPGFWLHEEAPTPGEPVRLEFDLGEIYPLSETWIWQFHYAKPGDTPDYYRRGARHVTIKHKAAETDPWTALGNFELGYADYISTHSEHTATNLYGPFDDPNDTAFMRPVKWGGREARYVQFEITSNWGDSRFVGLSEVRFYTEGAALRVTPDGVYPWGDLWPAATSAEPEVDFGIVDVGAHVEQEFLVWNAGSEGASLIIDSLDATQLPSPFSVVRSIAPGSAVVARPIGRAEPRGAAPDVTTASLVTIAVDTTDIGRFTGRFVVHYTDSLGSHVTTKTVHATGRCVSWGSIPVVRADAWRSYQTWDVVPSYSPWRMVDATNMRDPAPGVNGARSGYPAWNYAWQSGYFGWQRYRHNWVAFDFGKVVNIDEMLFWNARDADRSMKDVIISYTTDDVPHHGAPQNEFPLGPGGYPSFYNNVTSSSWMNAYGHYSGIEDTRWTRLATTNGGNGVHQFRQVQDNDWKAAPESVNFGGVAARWVRFDSLHDGTLGKQGWTSSTLGVQGMDNSKPTNPSGYGNWGNDDYIGVAQVRFYSGGPYPELLANIPAASGDMLRSSTNPYDLKPFVFPTQYYPFVTTSTALHIGNVGEAGTTVRIQEITFMDEDGDGTADPGPFSVAGLPAFPKSYAAGTTEAVALVWTPRRELATYDANVVVVADDGAGNLNKAVIPIRATSMAFEPGYIKPSEIVAIASLTQLNTTSWRSQLAYTRSNMMEAPSGVVGSKGAGQYRYGDNHGWLDAIAAIPLETPHYLEIELDSVRTLDEMHIFQHAQNANSNWNACLKDITIEYKVNAGDAWTRLGNKAWRVHNWYISDGVFPQPSYAANVINTHAPFKFPAGAQARFVRIAAAGGIGDADPAQSGLFGNWGSINYWGCAEIALYEPAPALSLDATDIDFGAVATGMISDRSIVAANNGTAPLNVSSVAIQGTGLPYSVLGASSFSIPAGSSQAVTIRFAPTAAGDYRGARALIESNAGGRFTYVRLDGVAVNPGAADLVPSPAGGSAIDFGNTNVGQSRTRTITLSNVGDADRTVTNISVTGIAFSASSATPLTVPKSGEGRLVLVCSPPSEGDFSGGVTIVTTDPDALMFTYALTAKGVIAPPAAAGRAWVMYY